MCRPLSQAPQIDRRYHEWSYSRLKFNSDLNIPGSKAAQDRWQKAYFRGQHPGGEAAEADGHRVRLRLKDFRDSS